jgi:predicted transcriptional regulator
MDVVYKLGRASAAEIHERLPEPPVPAAVRTMLRILEEKGHLRHDKEGPRHIYLPTTPRKIAQKSALRHVLGTFFDGSRAAAVAALLDESERPLTAAEREDLDQVLKRLRAQGR